MINCTITRCDSSATILFKFVVIHILSLSNSHNSVASIQKNREDKLHDYRMRYIGYDSIQTRWFISYCFQIRTIMEVTLQYPALKRFLLVSADMWYGSNTPTWINYYASVLQSLTYLLIRAHFSEMGRGQFNMSPFKALPISWDGSSFWWMGCWKFFMLPLKTVSISVMASHSGGWSFNRSLLVILQIELTLERLESYSVRFKDFQRPT